MPIISALIAAAPFRGWKHNNRSPYYRTQLPLDCEYDSDEGLEPLDIRLDNAIAYLHRLGSKAAMKHVLSSGEHKFYKRLHDAALDDLDSFAQSESEVKIYRTEEGELRYVHSADFGPHFDVALGFVMESVALSFETNTGATPLTNGMRHIAPYINFDKDNEPVVVCTPSYGLRRNGQPVRDDPDGAAGYPGHGVLLFALALHNQSRKALQMEQSEVGDTELEETA